MRVVYAGTPEFSVPCLQALSNRASVKIVAVYTQPDRRAGRGKKPATSPVKNLAGQLGLPVFQPESLQDTGAQEQLRALRPDLVLVVAYGLILPAAVLETPRLGCLNIHASLLPRWRGAAPVQRAIEHGDTRTGVTLMQLQPQLDSGPVLAQREIRIGSEETGGMLQDRLARLGARLIEDTLEDVERKQLVPEPQDPLQATYAAKLTKAESGLDWGRDAQHLERKIRAFNPWPVATARICGLTLRIHKACGGPRGGRARCGRILRADKQGILVQAGGGTLNLEILQKPGGRPLAAADLLNGMPLQPGMVFEPPA
ncbi:MAG: methionyl-tRNA formyltransferase [Gammaproteobacteria bacterium]|nr:methionyl-tRNA formyltransferase [Gammaproteobacteria bacterium]